MEHVLYIPELVTCYMEWSVDVAFQLMALEGIGAVGVKIGALEYDVVPWFED